MIKAYRHEYVKLEPVDDEKIWRYMDLSKFMYLIQYNSLYFPRADLFEDEKEGKLTAGDKKRFIDDTIDYMKSDDTLRNKLSYSYLEKQWESYRDKIEINFKRNVFVSCWNVAEVQSNIMWRFYGKNKESLCIQTTYKKFKDRILKENQYAEIAAVKYIDYNSENEFSSNFPYFNKRRGFAEENEVRAVIWKPDAYKNKIYGLDINFDISSTIENIYVNPNSDDWFKKLIEDIVKKYGYNIPVIKEELS